MLTLEDFIEKGYLPFELIPALNTTSLSKVVNKLLPNLSGYPVKSSISCNYSIPKVKQIRRELSIPNPLHQLRLCKILYDNWSSIESFLSGSKLSKSTPLVKNPFFQSDEPRTFYREIKIADIPIQRSLHSNSARYLLKTDLSRFFPTIYTHSIPWALHTKDAAKASIGRNGGPRSLYGNLIDEAVRNTQDKQTSGIQIGPDSSYIISEIIMVAIDCELVKSLNSNKIKYKGFRFIDDYYLYFSKLSDAEYALSALYGIVKDYELELNSYKTKIVELPDILDSKWVLDLRGFSIESSDGKVQSENLIAYFSKAFELSKLFPEDSVLKYALNEIADVWVDEEYWSLYQSLILKSIIAEPAILPTATEIFLAYKKLKYPLNKVLIKETLYELITYHSKHQHSHELSWALWLCKSLNIRVTKDIALVISNVEDCVVALIALDLKQLGLIKVLDTTKWVSFMNSQELYSSNWLLAYEAYCKGWLTSKDGSDYIKDDSFFNILKKNKVSFYDGSNQVKAALVEQDKLDVKKTKEKRERRRRKMGY